MNGLRSIRDAALARLERRGAPGAVVLALGLLLAAQGCEWGGSAEETGPRGLELEGAPLLVGTSLDQWSLVEVPREGGTARIRSARDPGQVVREGGTTLPASRDVRFVGERQVFLRADDGAVLHYDPEADEVTRIGTAGSEPSFSSWNGYGVYVAGDGSTLLEVGGREAWAFEIAGRPVWATPVEEGRIAVLVEEAEDRRSLWLLRRGDAQPESRTAAAYRAPGLATAWGRRLVFRSANGNGLQFVAVPSLTAGQEVDVDGRVTALAASASSHEIYAAVEDPPRIVAVNRFSQETRELGEVDGPVTELRAAILGQSLLARAGDRVWWLPVGGGDAASTEGSWRSDLPLVLPDGRVLLARDDAPWLWNPEAGSQPEPLADASAGRSWGMVRWNPAPEPVVSDPARVGAAAGEATPPGPSEAEADEGEGADVEEDPPADAEGEAPAETAETAQVPAGFYAVATSAREADGVRDLVGELEASGYPTTLQRHDDDAGRTWYRALVGPYPERPEAEAAARQLRRERDLAAWVVEIEPGLP